MSGNIIGKTLLNQFRVDAFIASGGMGTVYRVWDLKRNVPLAMKVLHADLAEDPSILKKFQREARALQKLAHPNIVPFYGLHQTSDFFFLLEKYIDGPTLKDVLREKRSQPSLEEALFYFTALCSALGFAHHNGVVHCDIKPGNVMVDRGGSIYLADFGIARHAESTVTTSAGAGTPAYMAPEQIRGESVTSATDVYALGILLYEMLTGVRPFRGNEPGLEKSGVTAGERIRYAQLNAHPPDPRQFNSSIPSELAEVILRALAKSSDERYHNAMEMLAAVQEAVGVKDGSRTGRVNISTNPSTLPPRGGPQEFSASTPPVNLVSKKIIFAGLFFLVVAFGAVAINQIGGPPLPPAATIAENTVEVPIVSKPEDSPALPTPDGATNTTVPEVSSNGSSNWIAYTYGANQDSTALDPRYLAMINVQTREERRLTFDNGGVNFPSFSPDGNQIVYTGCKAEICQLYVLDVNSGKVEEISGINMKAMWPDWCRNPGTDLIAFEGRSGTDRRIYVADRSKGTVTAITKGPFDIRPSWSSDCSKLVFLRDFNEQDDIYVYDLEEKREHAIVESPYDEFNVSWAPNGNRILFTRVSSDTNGDGFINLDDRSDLYLMNSDGSGEISLSKGQYSVFSPSFSSDGKSIVFIAFNGSAENQQIVVYSTENGSFTPLTSYGPFNHTDWSP